MSRTEKVEAFRNVIIDIEQRKKVGKQDPLGFGRTLQQCGIHSDSSILVLNRYYDLFNDETGSPLISLSAVTDWITRTPLPSAASLLTTTGLTSPSRYRNNPPAEVSEEAKFNPENRRHP